MLNNSRFSTVSVRALDHSERQEQLRFDRWRTRVIRSWRARLEKQKRGELLRESPDAYLARKIYAHLCIMLEPHGGWRILHRIVEQSRSLDTGRFPIRGKPFKLGLVAFLGNEKGFGKNRRSEWSDAMLYAYMHRIQPQNYVGFVKQVGQKRVRTKLENNEVEPGFIRSKMRPCPRSIVK